MGACSGPAAVCGADAEPGSGDPYAADRDGSGAAGSDVADGASGVAGGSGAAGGDDQDGVEDVSGASGADCQDGADDGPAVGVDGAGAQAVAEGAAGAAGAGGATGVTGATGIAGVAGVAGAAGEADIAALIVVPAADADGDELIAGSACAEPLLDLSEPGRLKYQFVCSCEGVIAPG